MVRLVFVVNEHPNEAFGISTARETAKELQKQGFKLLVEGKNKISNTPQGNEIVLVKVKAAKTLLGRMLKGLPIKTREQKQSGADPNWYWTYRHNFDTRAKKAKKYKPTAIYTFHCAPQGDNVYFNKGRVDYQIATYEQIPIGGRFVPTKVIELKTVQKRIPIRPAMRIKKHLELKTINTATRYLTHTTSNALTRKAGLTPEVFGKSLAKKISNEVRAMELGQIRLAPVTGRIKRVPWAKPKSPVQKPKKKRKAVPGRRKL